MDELKQIDEVMAIYKPHGARNKQVLLNLLTDLEEWAGERGFNLLEILQERNEARVP